MSSSKDSAIVDSLATYGRVKATIGLVSSIVIAVILLCSAYLAFKGKIVENNLPVIAHVVKKENCNAYGQCVLVVEYLIDGRRQLQNIVGSNTAQIGDTVNINVAGGTTKKSKINPFVLVGISVLLLGGGIMYYIYVMKNKYAAVNNALSTSYNSYSPFNPYNRGLLSINL